MHSISFSQILSDDDEGDLPLDIFVQQFSPASHVLLFSLVMYDTLGKGSKGLMPNYLS